ncbi:MAG: class A beta-lactamase [Hylemonella sp.]|uniref:class A beta-lactamase n=1 Tax=Hylemonella sp. TaxID=2066020 RepID=UPI0022BD2080|nr:class A beta-lactamase [Hylemonella sp.]MCZ8253419.1 class A beta-lactamase [Hylemonella sp.]
MLDRRALAQSLLALAIAGPLGARAENQKSRGRGLDRLAPATWREIEAAASGRLGVAVLDTATGQVQGYRLDERFPLCSTFKWLLGAHVLRRVDLGLERLDRTIVYGPEAIIPWSPVTATRVGQGMTLAELCEATITLSDNAAANLILRTLGGPQGWTQYVRSLGDTVTRLDRTEPELNAATPGDPRDTTSPRAMVALLQGVVLGDALTPASRAQLVTWMQATQTSGQRLGAQLPTGWRLGSKTGTGARGSTNDVGVYWPPDRAPIVVAAYLTQSPAGEATRNRAIARVASAVISALAPT